MEAAPTIRSRLAGQEVAPSMSPIEKHREPRRSGIKSVAMEPAPCRQQVHAAAANTVGHDVCGYITVTKTLGMSEDGLRDSAVGHSLFAIGFRLPPKCVTNHIGIGPLRIYRPTTSWNTVVTATFKWAA